MESKELRARVELTIGHNIPNELWEKTKNYAMQKFCQIEQHDPQGRGDEYLVAITAETQMMFEFSAMCYERAKIREGGGDEKAGFYSCSDRGPGVNHFVFG